MPLIDIQRAEPGVLLVADVEDRRGNPLLRAGTELTEAHIRSLSSWGVRVIEIEGEETSNDLADVDPGELMKARSAVDDHFRHVGVESHPFIAALRECALEAWLRRRGGGAR